MDSTGKSCVLKQNSMAESLVSITNDGSARAATLRADTVSTCLVNGADSVRLSVDIHGQGTASTVAYCQGPIEPLVLDR
jgi:hypothetical protein